LLPLQQETGVTPRRRGVHRHGLLSGKAPQVVWAARLRARAGQPGTAERLRADNRANHIAVDVDVAVGEPPHDVLGGVVDARMNAEGKPIAIGGVVIYRLVNFVDGQGAHLTQWGVYFIAVRTRSVSGV